MSWLNNFVRPKIRALVGKKDVPDNLWHKCPSCEQMLFHRELSDNLYVCQACGHHIRLAATARMGFLFDSGKFTRVQFQAVTPDPLKFRDSRRYTERLKDAQNKSEKKRRSSSAMARSAARRP
jgi:acetyl-CoA carboxylase carboxyl transferase subunit beta